LRLELSRAPRNEHTLPVQVEGVDGVAGPVLVVVGGTALHRMRLAMEPRPRPAALLWMGSKPRRRPGARREAVVHAEAVVVGDRRVSRFIVSCGNSEGTTELRSSQARSAEGLGHLVRKRCTGGAVESCAQSLPRIHIEENT
jgi:hypothetical protein